MATTVQVEMDLWRGPNAEHFKSIGLMKKSGRLADIPTRRLEVEITEQFTIVKPSNSTYSTIITAVVPGVYTVQERLTQRGRLVWHLYKETIMDGNHGQKMSFTKLFHTENRENFERQSHKIKVIKELLA
jgi:hypothetical protein